MSSTFFNLFLQGNYQEAIQANPNHEVGSYFQNHYHIAQFLSNPNCPTDQISALSIEPKILELVALRNETGFDYNSALKLRHALQQISPSPLNQLSILNVSLKIKPINECRLEVFDQIDLESETSSPFLATRILSIIEFIVDNHCLAALPQTIIEKSSSFFTSQLNSQLVPGYRALYNCGQLSFWLRDYRQALTYFRESWQLGYTTDECADGIIKCLVKLDILSEAFTYIKNSIHQKKNDFRLFFRYSQLVNFLGDGDKLLDNLNIAHELLNHEVRNTTALSRIFHSNGNYNLAVKYYYKLLGMVSIYNQICSGLLGIMKLIGSDAEISANQNKEMIGSNIQALCRQSVISLPTSYDSAIATAILANWKGSSISELDILTEARVIAPNSVYIANRLLALLGDNQIALKEQICLHFLKYDNFEQKPEFMLQLAALYLRSGFILEVYQIMDYFQDFLLNKSDDVHLSYSTSLNIYFSLGFVVPSVRDSILFNNLMFVTTSIKLKEKLYEWKKCIDELHQINYPTKSESQKGISRIAFVSPHFRGHVVSLFSLDVITELSLIEGLEVLMIPVDKSCKDSQFLQNVKQIPTVRVVEVYESASQIVKALTKMNIDVLVDLDGLTALQALPVLYTMPAIVNCTWLGFDAPYLSERNFFLCDRFTHPPEVDEFYPEQLVRLPHSHMCVGSLGVADKDRELVRNELGLSEGQIVFIYPAAVRKFNFNIAIAHAQILSQVPNSVLMVKTSGGYIDRPLQVWKEELSAVGVSHDRIVFIPRAKTPEEHRFYFKVADVYLDAYPYNGGSQTVEALWCELPVVTYCGEQSFARMGYSFLSNLGITDCIAHSWEEYVEWAVRLATDRSLYQKIKQRLYEAKQPETLSPLWNPKQFARDMYDILQDLYNKAGNEQAD